MVKISCWALAYMWYYLKPYKYIFLLYQDKSISFFICNIFLQNKLNEYFQSKTHHFIMSDMINITLYIKIHFLSLKNSTYFNAVDSIFCPFVCQGLIQIVLLAVGIFWTLNTKLFDIIFLRTCNQDYRVVHVHSLEKESYSRWR